MDRKEGGRTVNYSHLRSKSSLFPGSTNGLKTSCLFLTTIQAVMGKLRWVADNHPIQNNPVILQLYQTV